MKCEGESNGMLTVGEDGSAATSPTAAAAGGKRGTDDAEGGEREREREDSRCSRGALTM